MPLPSSGAISLSQVNTELGLSATATISMNDSAVRTLFGVGGSGTGISMSQGYGKANQFNLTISSNQTNANLRTLAVNAGWNQVSRVVATINSGVYVSSNSTGTPALTVNGSFPNGVSLTNNGFIIGMGGAGGNGVTTSFGFGIVAGSGAAGGLALSVSTAISITNNGTIGGGGGGGGASSSAGYQQGDCIIFMGGAGGGGGRSSAAANSAGGTRGAQGNANLQYSGNGNPGTVSAAGAGGNGALFLGGIYTGAGGNGGGWGAAGGAGAYPNYSQYYTGGPGGGGAGGGAVSGNGNITWVATGTRLGSIS